MGTSKKQMSGDNEYCLKSWTIVKQHFLIQTYRVTILKQFTTRPLLTGSSRAQANIFLNSQRIQKAKDLIEKVQRWFYDRNLQTQDPNKQFLKLYEEIGELSRGLAENDEAVTKDSIGDITVVLIGLTLQLGIKTEEIFPENNTFVFLNAAKSEDYFVVMMDQSLAAYFNRQSYQLKNVVYELMRISALLHHDFVECLNIAYEEIKDRTGKLVDGVWIKEERLK